MITSLRLRNFKNFADETLRMGPFTVIVGANASGKSNIRDAFRFLHGIGRGYRVADIVGGKYGAGGQVEWEQIRGAADEIIRFGCENFDLLATIKLADGTFLEFPYNAFSPNATYRIEIGAKSEELGSFTVKREQLHVVPATFVYDSHPPAPDKVRLQNQDSNFLIRMAKTGGQRKAGHPIAVRPDQPALTQIHEHKKIVRLHKDIATDVSRIFESMRFMDLSPTSLRQPAFPGQTVLGDSGENLPTVLKEICKDPGRKKSLIDWTRELTPMDVKDFEFPADPTTGRIQLAFKESSGKTVSAYSASDGTLRFLAILAALLGRNPAGLYVFEEIDNGIHPSRVRLLIDLIEQQTTKSAMQVVTTTHSAELLSMISDDTFENTSVVCRNPNTDDAVIRPISKLPNAEKLRKSQGLGRLHAGGWLENAVWFSEAGNETSGGGA